MDKLDQMWNLQASLIKRYLAENYSAKTSLTQVINTLINNKTPNSKFREGMITDSCNFLAEESFELKRLFNYKSWKTWKTPDMEKAKEELIDIWHFILQITIFLGLSPEELLYEFKKKNFINHERQDGGY